MWYHAGKCRYNGVPKTSVPNQGGWTQVAKKQLNAIREMTGKDVLGQLDVATRMRVQNQLAKNAELKAGKPPEAHPTKTGSKTPKGYNADTYKPKGNSKK